MKFGLYEYDDGAYGPCLETKVIRAALTMKTLRVEPTRLRNLSDGELAHLLADCPRHSQQWRLVRAECDKRMRRMWNVAAYAGAVILACLLLVALRVLSGG